MKVSFFDKKKEVRGKKVKKVKKSERRLTKEYLF